MPQKRMECFRLIFNHLAWIEHQLFRGIRDSRKPGSLWERCGRSKEVNRPDLIGQTVRVTMLMFYRNSGRDSLGRGQHSSNRVSGISTRTMHQSTTPSLSQTVWPRWVSRQFLTVPIVQTLFPVTFGYSLSSETVVMRQLKRWKRLWRRSLTRFTEDDFHGAFQKLLEWYNKCISAGGDYFEGDKSFMRVQLIKVPIRKSLETYRMLLVSLSLSIYLSIYLSPFILSFEKNL